MNQALEPYRLIDPQLWVITSAHGERRSGLIATFVTKASIVPNCPRFVIGLAQHHETCRLLEASGYCAMHLFEAAQQHWIERFGIPSGANTDKLSNIEWTTWTSRAPVLSEALAAFECRVEAEWPIGDRTLFLLEVLKAEKFRQGTPLRFSEMWEAASEDVRQQLSDLMEQDQKLDEAAILKWRAQR